MHQSTIIYPLIGMVFLTFVVGVKMLASRIRAVKKEGMNPAFFALNRGAKQPDYLVKVSQHYENLFELPILFYVVSLLIFITNKTDPIYIVLAVSFVTVRYIHAVIHITYNNLIHRRNVFLMGSMVLLIMWLRLSFQLVRL